MGRCTTARKSENNSNVLGRIHSQQTQTYPQAIGIFPPLPSNVQVQELRSGMLGAVERVAALQTELTGARTDFDQVPQPPDEFETLNIVTSV